MSEEILIRQGAPTLAGIKTGSLFPCPCEDREELLADIRRLNRRAGAEGAVPAADALSGKGRALLYLYRPAGPAARPAGRSGLPSCCGRRAIAGEQLRAAAWPRLVQPPARGRRSFRTRWGCSSAIRPRTCKGFIDHRANGLQVRGAVEGVRRRGSGPRPCSPGSSRCTEHLLRTLADRLRARSSWPWRSDEIFCCYIKKGAVQL